MAIGAASGSKGLQPNSQNKIGLIYNAHCGIMIIHLENFVNIDTLLNMLENGYATTKTTPEGEQFQVLHTPNKYMLAAGKLIRELADRLNRNQQYMNQLLKERNDAIAELDLIKSTRNDDKVGTSTQSS